MCCVKINAVFFLRVCVCQDEDMSADHPTRTAVMAHPVAERLDALMAVLLAYIKDFSHFNGNFYTVVQ